MKRSVIGAAAGLALHLLAVAVLAPYRDLVFDLGGLLVRHTDIADIPDMALAGVALTSVASMVLGVAVERILRLWHPPAVN